MKKIKGIEGSSGIGVGKAFILETPNIEIRKTKCDPTEETKLFNNALSLTKKQLTKLKEEAKKTIGEEKAMIFDAHLQILEDPMLIDGITTEINGNSSVEYAINSTCKGIANIFRGMEDEYMQERAADVLDISKRLTYNALGIEQVDLTKINSEVIIVADDITPSQSTQLNKKFVKGFVTNIGGRTSHAAIIARSLEIPAILGTKTATTDIKDGDSLIIDGFNGDVIINGDDKMVKEYENKSIKIAKEMEDRKKFNGVDAITLDGVKISVQGNIGDEGDAKIANNYKPNAIGLLRTEVMYMNKNDWPTEDELYDQLVASCKQLPSCSHFVVRTLDIGGDKKLKYFKFPQELNPFLGYRAIRMCLDLRLVFKTQLRAILRASAKYDIRIMLPMITVVEEILESKKIISECMRELKKEDKDFNANIQIGIMAEAPSVMYNPELFCKHADFFSIGTNDLIQYSFAVDRMSETVTHLYQPYNPSLLKAIKKLLDTADQFGKSVCMCGEMAGESKAIPLLLGLGLKRFSMSATSINKVKKIINNVNHKDCVELVDKAMELETNEQVTELTKKFLDKIGGIMYGKR